MNQIYGFEGEVKAKYTAQMYELFSEVFEWLPLAQCINGKVLVRSCRASCTMWVTCWRGKDVEGAPSLTVTNASPRSCMEACSVRMVSPWMTSGRLSGIGSLQTQVSGPRHGEECLGLHRPRAIGRHRTHFPTCSPNEWDCACWGTSGSLNTYIDSPHPQVRS